MSQDQNTLTKILNEIKTELANLISLAKDSDKIDSKNLSKQAETLNEIIRTSGISEKDRNMLQKFALTLQEGISVKNLRYEKQDLERVLSNLND